MNAHILALILAGKAVSIALAASVPETRTAAILEIIVPIHRVVGARTTVGR